jgi:large subunit ribosomal protein L25
MERGRDPLVDIAGQTSMCPSFLLFWETNFMAQHAELKAETRTMLGKKVRQLRRAGKLPATVYGHNIKPQSIQVDAHDLRSILRSSGRNQLIDLMIDSQRARPVFIRQTEINAKRHELLHIEFYQANLTEKMVSRVPIHLIGESQAVKDGGILLTVLDHVDVESLPDNVPGGGVDVNLETLQEINAAIHASDLSLPEGVTLVTPPDEMIVKVNPAVTEEAVEATLAEPTALPAELGGDETPPDSVPEA